MTPKLMLGAVLAAAALAAGGAYARPDANQMAAVADKARPEADARRDADRKPAEPIGWNLSLTTRSCLVVCSLSKMRAPSCHR